VSDLNADKPAAAPLPADVSSSVQEEWQRFGALVKKRLAQDVLTAADARDGLRDCFVATYLGGVIHGLEGFALRGDVQQVERVIESMFRRRLRENGTSWESPSIEGLQATKDAIDVEVHFDVLPAEFKALHDQVCTLLLGKVRGDLGHVGDRSAVAVEARALRAKAPEDPVVTQLRLTVATLLDQMASQVRGGESVEALFDRAGQLLSLLELVKQLSAKPVSRSIP
jgi:hypothetical protein